jgi:hypothetical protein
MADVLGKEYEKVLFFADLHFLFFNSRRSFGTLPFNRQRTTQVTGHKSKNQIAKALRKKVNN